MKSTRLRLRKDLLTDLSPADLELVAGAGPTHGAGCTFMCTATSNSVVIVESVFCKTAAAAGAW